MWRVPPCGKNEGLNALVHAGLAALYFLAIAYHATCVKEHLARRDPK